MHLAAVAVVKLYSLKQTQSSVLQGQSYVAVIPKH